MVTKKELSNKNVFIVFWTQSMKVLKWLRLAKTQNYSSNITHTHTHNHFLKFN